MRARRSKLNGKPERGNEVDGMFPLGNQSTSVPRTNILPRKGPFVTLNHCYLHYSTAVCGRSPVK